VPFDGDGLAGVGRSTRIALVVAAVALIAVAAGAVVLISRSSSESPPASDAGGFFGIASSATLDSEDLPLMVLTRVTTVRFLLGWSQLEPSQGTFDWSQSDERIGALAAHGIQPFPFVYNSPAWVSADPAHPPLDTASDRAAWTDFLKAVVERYGPGGSYWTDSYNQQFGSGAKPLPVTSWQIWNEPNLPHYFAPRSSASKYARLLELSREAIVEQDPNAEIVLAGMPGYGKPDTAWGFLDKLYRQRGFADAFDAVALHPYARTVDQLRLEIDKLRMAMAENGDGDTPLWLTEVGWGSGPPNRFGLNKGRAGQKRLLEESFRLILDRRQAWHIPRLFWFDWRDPPPGTPQSCSFCSSAGLLASDGKPKPAWHAFRELASEGRQ
jgi:hypothetical protein